MNVASLVNADESPVQGPLPGLDRRVDRVGFCHALFEVAWPIGGDRLRQAAEREARRLEMLGEDEAVDERLAFAHHALHGETDDDVAAWFEACRARAAATPDIRLRLDVADVPGGRQWLAVSLASLIADPPSLRLFAARLDAALRGEPSPAAVPWADVADVLQSVREAAAGEPARRYWKSRPWANALTLPAGSKRGDAAFSLQRERLKFRADRTGKLEALADGWHCTSGDIVAASLAWVLSDGGRRTALFGWLETFRGYAGLESVVGPLATYVPTFVELPPRCTASEAVATVLRARPRGSRAEQWTWDLLGVEGRLPVLFDADDDSNTRTPGRLLALRQTTACSEPCSFRLGWRRDRSQSAADIELAWDHGHADRAAARRLADGVFQTLERICSDPQAALALPESMSEHRPTPAMGHPGPRVAEPFPERFARVVRNWPDRPAVVSGGSRLTYRELDQQASALAARLRRLGVGLDDRVAIALPRSTSWTVALIAALKVGGAFAPIDPGWPTERVRRVLGDLEPSAIVTDRTDLPSAAPVVAVTADGPMAGAPPSAPDRRRPPQTAAYVLYTSGSTGAPKGVVVTDDNLAHYLDGLLALLEVDDHTPPLSWAHVSTLAADLGHSCLFPALATGGCLHLLDDEQVRDGTRFADYLGRQAIDVLKIVPAHWAALQAGHGAAPRRALVFGGDVLPPGLIVRLAPEVAARVFNHYGPTETTVGCLGMRVGRCTPGGSAASVPLGHPLGEAEVLLLDGGRLCGDGESGEICVGGPGVTRGYLRAPAVTAERFVPHPFAAVHGARLYRTGDRGRRRPDGAIEFLGRMDSQVKIHGHRIELGEITSALCAVSDVVASAVAAIREWQGEQRLIAWIVPMPGVRVDPEALRAHLSTQLPAHMTPIALVTVAAWPLTDNGKIDRDALPLPEPAASGTGNPPRSDRERTLAAIWARVLKRPGVGIDDDFFSLGGDSIAAIQMVGQACKAGLRMTPAHLFRHRTIAACLEALGPVTTTVQPGPARSTTPETTAVRRLPLVDGQLETSVRERYPGTDDVYPVTSLQHGILFDCLLRPDAGAYVSQYSCEFGDDFDARAFEEAWQTVVDRHSSLRTRFHWEGLDTPLQLVATRGAAPTWRREDWAEVADDEIGPRMEVLRDETRALVTELKTGVSSHLTLTRLAGGRHWFLWTYHHLILDGWSQALIARDLQESYRASRASRPAALPRPGSYRSFVERLSTADWTEARAFWRAHLEGYRAAPRLSGAVTGAAGHAEQVQRLEPPIVDALLGHARALGVTPSAVAHACWALVLHRLNGASDQLVGVTVSGRPPDLEGADETVGLFLSTIPFRSRVDPGTPWTSWMRTLHEGLAAARQHEHLPLVEMSSLVGSGRPLFETLFTFQSTPDFSEPKGPPLARDEGFRGGGSGYALSLDIEPGTEWRVTVTCDRARLDPAIAGRAAAVFAVAARFVATRRPATVADVIHALADADREVAAPRRSPAEAPRPSAFAAGRRKSIVVS